MPALPLIQQELKNKANHDRWVMLYASKEMGSSGVSTLALALKDENDFVRWWSAEILGGMGRVAAPALPAMSESLINDPHEGVRAQIAISMGKIGSTPALNEALNDPSESVRFAARSAIDKLRLGIERETLEVDAVR